MDVFEELKWRGLIENFTPGIDELLKREKIVMYIGFDPTARSLHVGSLVPIITMMWMQRYGHQPIAIVGGGTGLIGDPSGKSEERPMLTPEQIEENLKGIKRQLSVFLDFEAKDNPAIILNNLEWLGKLKLLEFLRDFGKYVTVNYMLSKEGVKRRLESEVGISYTEFSYMLLQAYDYLFLYDHYNCRLQMGGSDQWGNITLGIKIIERLRGVQVYGIVSPLITTASGRKFGKTEEGTVWLDPELTSPYQFYQFWYNTDDRDIERYLKIFTFLSKEEIEELIKYTRERPEKREAQKRLAEEVTKLVHGEEGLKKAKKATAILFGGKIEDVTSKELEEIFKDVPSKEILIDRLKTGVSIIEFLYEAGITSSKSEARRLVEGGGVYIQNEKCSKDKVVTMKDAIEGKLIVVRVGKKNYYLVNIKEE